MTKRELLEAKLNRKFVYESTALWERLHAEFIEQLKELEREDEQQQKEQHYILVAR